MNNVIKWNITGFSKYGITENSEVIHMRSGRIKRMIFNGYSWFFFLWDDSGKRCIVSKTKLKYKLAKLVKK